MESFIRVIKYFISISGEEQDFIKSLFNISHLKQGDYFLREGEICRHVAFIQKGLVRHFLTTDGTERTMHFNKEDEFISNYQSFLLKKASSKSIQALEETTLYLISFENLHRLYTEVKEGEKFGRLAVEYVYLIAMEQLNSLYTDSPTNRYKQFLVTYPALVQRIPQYYIASFVGIKPQSLSRIRKKIAKPIINEID